MKHKYHDSNKKWREKNREHINQYTREYYLKNKEKLSLWNKEWREKNKDRFSEIRKKWRAENPEKVKEYQAKQYIKNRDSIRKKSSEWRKNNPEKVHLGKIKRKFGITEEQYLLLRKIQEDECAICGRSEDYQRLGVDHNHKSGQIRGLLCARCNTGIGSLQDSVILLENAIIYLKKHEQKTTK